MNNKSFAVLSRPFLYWVSGLLALGVLAFDAHAMQSPKNFRSSKQQIQNLANEFLAKTFLVTSFKTPSPSPTPVPTCFPPHGQVSVCVDSACAKLGSFGCDTQTEVLDVVKACQGNYGRDCLDAACTYLGSFGCDTQSEVVQIATACRGNIDSACLVEVCTRLGSFGCNTQAAVTDVLTACGGGHP